MPNYDELHSAGRNRASSWNSSKKPWSRRNAWGDMSYADLISQAIESSPDGRMTLSEIYDWVIRNVPYFRDKGNTNSSAGWKVIFVIVSGSDGRAKTLLEPPKSLKTIRDRPCHMCECGAKGNSWVGYQAGPSSTPTYPKWRDCKSATTD